MSDKVVDGVVFGEVREIVVVPDKVEFLIGSVVIVEGVD